MFSSSKDDTPADTPAAHQPFSQLVFLARQLRTLGIPLGQAVQLASVRISSSLSISGPGVEARLGKFDFGVGAGEGGVNLVDV